MYPAETEGPFYQGQGMVYEVRSDVTEGRPGTPFVLTVVVVRATGCAPVVNAAIDIWHCDADGVYSGFPGQLGNLDTTGQTFFRGTQITDANGRVEFTTIYPGWYPGRTTHIHFKIHPTSTSEATSQMYFPEVITSAVYQTGVYAAHGQKDTTNAADGAVAGNLPPLLAVTQTSTGYAATLTIVVAG